MQGDQIISVYIRDLKALRREIEAYPTEQDIWRLPPGVANSGGTLALHLAGSLRYLIGTVLGGSAYVRDRNAEFTKRDVPRAELLAGIDAAIADLERARPKVTDQVLAAEYPVTLAGCRVVAGEMLTHFVAHCGYHVGQVDYHRRIVTGQGQTVGAMAIPELPHARKVE
jgi:hypothetical protein